MKGATRADRRDDRRLRGELRDKNIRHAGLREGHGSRALPRRAPPDKATTDQRQIRLDLREATATTPAGRHAQARGQRSAPGLRAQQNITTLRNRVNELGVAEPIIQQQGADRIVVQLPGVQDTAPRLLRPHRHPRDPHGRRSHGDPLAGRRQGPCPAPSSTSSAVANRCWCRSEVAHRRAAHRRAARLRRQNREPGGGVSLDAPAPIDAQVTRENLNKRMAILLIEKGKGGGDHGASIRSESTASGSRSPAA